MSRAVTQKKPTKPKDVFGIIHSKEFQKELKLVIPQGLDIKKYAAGVENTLRTSNNDKLLACSPSSIARCVLTAATLGLEVDAKAHAYLVPYKGQCQLIPGYKGYISKIVDSPIVSDIYTQVVYEGDEFKVSMGTNPQINHFPDFDKDRSDDVFKAVYSVLRYTSGNVDFEVMTKSQVDEIRDTAKKDEIWNAYYGEMARKTVIRRFAKRLQLPKTEMLLKIDDLHSQGNIVNIEKGAIVAEENKSIEPPNNPERNKKIINHLAKEVKSVSNKLKRNHVIEYSIALFSENDPTKLKTHDLEELLKEIAKDFKIAAA